MGSRIGQAMFWQRSAVPGASLATMWHQKTLLAAGCPGELDQGLLPYKLLIHTYLIAFWLVNHLNISM